MRVLAALLFCLPLLANADTLIGKVVKVSDGDTITILDNSNQQHKIRFSGIDAPEKSQAFGQRSKQSLANLIAGKTVKVDWNKRDRYRRIIGKVLLAGIDINLQQIKNGLAWHYKAYEREQDVEDRSIYAHYEYVAQEARKGLWSDDSPIAPWVFRKLHH